jgi:circadian clock protein KaiC
MPLSQSSSKSISTGISGLDFILQGGMPENRIFLIHGAPGTGKSTLGYQFLLEGVRRNERVLYVSLLQTLGEVEDIFRSHGWTPEGIEILELFHHTQDPSFADQSLFDTSDMELSTTTEKILLAMEEKRPARLVMDSLSELAIVLNNSAQFRSHLFRLKRQLVQNNCTALMISGETLGEHLAPVNTLVHGVIQLYQDAPAFTEPRRRLEITKIRGRKFAEGLHDFNIRTGGLEVFPRLQRLGSKVKREQVQFSSGNESLDVMLGGGLEEGTVCMVIGTPGVGKSSLGGLYAESAARQRLRAAVFCFDESKESYLRRISKLELSLIRDIEEGQVELLPIQMGDMHFGEFMQGVRKKVEDENLRVVVIDSLTGMSDALSGPQDLPIRRFHELVSYLNYQGVLTIILLSTHGMLGELKTDINVSYLVDTVIFLRHFEAGGSVRRCIAVTKKRYGSHEHTIREFQVTRGGLQLGEPLTQFSGLLTGSPQLTSSQEQHLLNRQ